jgi:hypothetical protein
MTIVNRRRHARQRAVERYGFELNKKTRRELLRIIRSDSGDGVLQRVKVTCSRSVLRVEYQGEKVALVYSTTSNSVAA